MDARKNKSGKKHEEMAWLHQAFFSSADCISESAQSSETLGNKFIRNFEISL
jgi:hypothetical protein